MVASVWTGPSGGESGGHRPQGPRALAWAWGGPRGLGRGQGQCPFNALPPKAGRRQEIRKQMSHLKAAKKPRRPRRVTRTVPSEVGEGRGRLAQRRQDGVKPPLLAQLTATETPPKLLLALSFQKEEGNHNTRKTIPSGDSWWSRMPGPLFIPTAA